MPTDKVNFKLSMQLLSVLFISSCFHVVNVVLFGGGGEEKNNGLWCVWIIGVGKKCDLSQSIGHFRLFSTLRAGVQLLLTFVEPCIAEA